MTKNSKEESPLLAAAVKKDVGNSTYTFTCPVTDGTCAPFVSSGWPTDEIARARGQQHFEEHKTGEPLPTLEDFRAEWNLESADNGRTAVISAKDL